MKNIFINKPINILILTIVISLLGISCKTNIKASDHEPLLNVDGIKDDQLKGDDDEEEETPTANKGDIEEVLKLSVEKRITS